jgi:SAM-dependent methyltransferase
VTTPRPIPIRRSLVAAFTAFVLACAPAAGGSDLYEPIVGQEGKDVVWVPTPDALVDRMLRLARVTADDYVVDLGSGDGRIVMAAVRDFGARGLGIEYNPELVELSQKNATAAGLGEHAAFTQGDIFEEDFSDATVVTMYLLTKLNLKLRHILLAMKPGTRVVSHQFELGEWAADETSWVDGRPGHLWIVPANAGGRWRLSFGADAAEPATELVIEQIFQRIEGMAEFSDVETTLRNPRLEGGRIAFGFAGVDGELLRFEGDVEGNSIAGTVTTASGARPFTAQRVGDAPPIGGSEPFNDAS